MAEGQKNKSVLSNIMDQSLTTSVTGNVAIITKPVLTYNFTNDPDNASIYGVAVDTETQNEYAGVITEDNIKTVSGNAEIPLKIKTLFRLLCHYPKVSDDHKLIIPDKPKECVNELIIHVCVYSSADNEIFCGKNVILAKRNLSDLDRQTRVIKQQANKIASLAEKVQKQETLMREQSEQLSKHEETIANLEQHVALLQADSDNIKQEIDDVAVRCDKVEKHGHETFACLQAFIKQIAPTLGPASASASVSVPVPITYTNKADKH